MGWMDFCSIWLTIPRARLGPHTVATDWLTERLSLCDFKVSLCDIKVNLWCSKVNLHVFSARLKGFRMTYRTPCAISSGWSCKVAGWVSLAPWLKDEPKLLKGEPLVLQVWDSKAQRWTSMAQRWTCMAQRWASMVLGWVSMHLGGEYSQVQGTICGSGWSSKICVKKGSWEDLPDVVLTTSNIETNFWKNET
jgi:hypothetical protein